MNTSSSCKYCKTCIKAVLLSTLMFFVVGWLWYSVLFAKLVGNVDNQGMNLIFAFYIIIIFLQSFVIVCLVIKLKQNLTQMLKITGLIWLAFVLYMLPGTFWGSYPIIRMLIDVSYTAITLFAAVIITHKICSNSTS